MAKGRRNTGNSGMMPMPADWREALQWFVNTYGLYYGSTRGLFLSDWTDEQAVSLEAAVINLKSRGFSPFVVAGETIYQQAEFLFNESRAKVAFGRPLASKLELELSGNDVVIIDGLEAPEKSSHLWYLMYYLLFPRAIAGKVSILTTQLSYQEFIRYGHACPDLDFCGGSVSWEKLVWLIESCTINQELFKLAREESLPPMLKAEYYLYMALRDRGLEVAPQHVLGDYLLDFAMIQGDQRLNIECDILSALSGHEINTREAKRDFVLLSDGWQILKFSTSELLNNRAACADVVEDAWRGGRKRSQCGRLLSGKSLPATPELPADDLQRSAIVFGGGPFALAGGAGTGKTTCIAQRTAYLLSQGISPDNILALSFSADSARQLKHSMEAVVEKQLALRLNVMSFHDLGMKILRENLPAIRRKPPLKIEPSPQKVIQKLITKIRKEFDPVKLEMAGELDEFYVSAVISMYKSHLISAAKAREDAQGDSEEIIARLYQSYEDQLLKTNRIDKNDVFSLAVQILLENAEVRIKYQSAYEFVLVDEYQDVTIAQDMLARILASPQDNLFVAGDEDEAITENRNGCPELLSEFSFRYPNARTLVLEHNWRCHPSIVEHARWLLSYLERRKIQKDFVSAWGSAPSPAIFGPQPCIDEAEEVAWIAQQAKALIDAGRDAGHLAILYRQNQYETMLEAELVRTGLRFLASHSDNSMIPDEVGDMLAFLKLVMDPDGPRAREAFERVCQLGTKEIDPKLSATIASFAGANNLSYLKAVEIYAEATADQSCRELEQLVRIIRAMNQDKLPPSESIGYLRRTRRLNDYYKGIKVPPGQVYEPLKKLGHLEEEARKFNSVAEFVQHVEERMGEDEDTSDVQAIHVKSIFDVKGFEYPIVFLVGLAEGLIPLAGTADMEEERRQFYVAMTRAKEAIYLSYPVKSAARDLGPSRFLMEARLIPSTGMQLAPALRPAPVAEAVLEKQFAVAEPALAPSAQITPAPAVPTAPLSPLAPTVPASPTLPLIPAAMQQNEFAGFGVNSESAAAEAAYADYLASQTKAASPQREEATTGDPYYAQKDKVSGLSPYVDSAESSSVRQPGHLPPAKGSSVGNRSQPPPSNTEALTGSCEPAITAAQVARELDAYSPVPPGPPTSPKAARPAVSAGGPAPHPSAASGVNPIQPYGHIGQRSGAAGQAAAADGFNQPLSPGQERQQVAPLLQGQIPADLPAAQPKAPGHEYRAAVDIDALHALRGKNAYLDPSLLHGRASHLQTGLPVCSSCGNGLEANARFCGECGYSLPERIAACAGCALPLEPGAKFCGECGTPVQVVERSTEPLPEQKGKSGKSGWMIKFLKFLEN